MKYKISIERKLYMKYKMKIDLTLYTPLLCNTRYTSNNRIDSDRRVIIRRNDERKRRMYVYKTQQYFDESFANEIERASSDEITASFVASTLCKGRGMPPKDNSIKG